MFSTFHRAGVRGFLHEPEVPAKATMVLTHGAGGNCQSPLLIAVAETLCEAGIRVLRYDLPFRQQRASGSPHPSTAAKDREGLREAVAATRDPKLPSFLGGQSYGGRQASMLVAEDESLVNGLLLLSYPLHPPGKPDQLRTAHLPGLRGPTLFVHGTRDPFGSIAEIQAALHLIPGPHTLSAVEGAGHDLKRGKFDIPNLLRRPFMELVNLHPS